MCKIWIIFDWYKLNYNLIQLLPNKFSSMTKSYNTITHLTLQIIFGIYIIYDYWLCKLEINKEFYWNCTLNPKTPRQCILCSCLWTRRDHHGPTESSLSALCSCHKLLWSCLTSQQQPIQKVSQIPKQSWVSTNLVHITDHAVDPITTAKNSHARAFLDTAPEIFFYDHPYAKEKIKNYFCLI